MPVLVEDPKGIEREARQHLEPIQGVCEVCVHVPVPMPEPWAYARPRCRSPKCRVVSGSAQKRPCKEQLLEAVLAAVPEAGSRCCLVSSCRCSNCRAILIGTDPFLLVTALGLEALGHHSMVM